MDIVDNFRATAQELVCLAQRHGMDLEPVRKDFAFMRGQRYIDFWRKDELPGTGPANEEMGTLHYSMQGSIAVLPSVLKDSATTFRGGWTEAGTFDSIEQAFALLKAWLIDDKEIDDLPPRSIRRYGIF